MKALTIRPGLPDSGLLEEVPEPPVSDGPVLVETLTVGVCGTDLELASGRFGTAPQGRSRLVLGHESLGRVIEAPPGCGLAPGDLVAGIVRRPDPDPCEACAAGEWDMCRDGRFTEHGIVGRDGFCAERFRSTPEFLVRIPPRLGKLGVLLEPASVVAKVWEQVERIASRTIVRPRVVLVTGAGPIGLLAALLGVQRGLDVHVLDLAADGPKPGLVRELGATYHPPGIGEAGGDLVADLAADVVIECTGATPVILDVLRHGGRGITCLLGGCHAGRPLPFDFDAFTGGLIGGNGVVFGSVNSNRRHYEAASEALLRADPVWLGRLIGRRVPLEQWERALRREPGDVKTVIDVAE